MPIIEMVILGLALSMDAFAVTLSNLMAYPTLSRAKRIMLPLTFGLFQGIMPLIGYLIGSLAAGVIDLFAGPIALVLLGFIGGKMIFESVVKIRASKTEEDPLVPYVSEESSSTLSVSAILIQGVATSLDALIVGISLLALGANIALASGIIAVTTCACCILALIIGKGLGRLLGDKAQIIGGIILILIGIKSCFF